MIEIELRFEQLRKAISRSKCNCRVGKGMTMTMTMTVAATVISTLEQNHLARMKHTHGNECLPTSWESAPSFPDTREQGVLTINGDSELNPTGVKAG